MRIIPTLQQPIGLTLRSEYAALGDSPDATVHGGGAAALFGGADQFAPEHFAFDAPGVDGPFTDAWDPASAPPEVPVAGDAAVEGVVPGDELFAFDFADGMFGSDAAHDGNGALSPTWGLDNDTGFESLAGADAFAPESVLDAFSFDQDEDEGDAGPSARGSDDLPTDVAEASAPDGAPAAAADGGDAGMAAVGSTFAAKGGIPGPPGSGGGGGDDGGGGNGTLDEYLSGSADGDAGYDIFLDFKGNAWTVELQDAFINAADYFTTVITDDIGGGARYRGNWVDDLYVTATLTNIDGTGGVLGQAGPSAVWTANDLTAVGEMEFDAADAATYQSLGLWDDIVTHELMHVLGFGSLWNYGSHAGLVFFNQYTGQNAVDAYKATVDASATFVPVELDYGPGTAGSHWDEAALNNELMTGIINADFDPTTNDDNYLSEFSVASLADLGYGVTYQDYPYDDPFVIA